MKLKDYFLASETNNYQPWIMKPVALFCFCLVIWGLRLLIPTSFSFAAPGIDAYDLMGKISQERTNRFIPTLTVNSKLIAAANSKSNDMLARSYFAHVDPDGNYVWYRIENAGYKPYLTLGENLAMDFSDAQSVIEAWMNSPTHRANILNEKFQDQGLAAIYGLFEPGHSTIAVTSLFGALLKSSPQAKPSPQPTPPATTKPAAPPAAPAPPAQSEPKTEITINPDIKLRKKIIGENLVIELDVVVSGNPAKVTAQIKDKTIELLASAQIGQFLGVISLPQEQALAGESLTITAVDKSGEQTSSQLTLGDLPTNIEPTPSASGASERDFIRVLKIIFTVFALIYLAFLVIDSVIIHRTKIKRTSMNSSPHSLLFLLVVLLNLATIWI
ncbi:MAG: CAP domain-containing protein [Candidatus Doudnabacteria bacterium]|nr:CAP domain-containing protein [Candidatus Doudnabacteria bacterium]